LSKSIFWFFLLLPHWAWSENFSIPALNSAVVDQAQLLRPAQVRYIEDSLERFKQSHGAQIQVLIVSQLYDEPIESAAIRVFDKWKLGDEKRDDGLLLLIALQEKRMRIEVGQGLEGSLPDVIAKRIVSDIMRPYFQRGDFFNGIKLGVEAIQGTLLKDPELLAQYSSSNGSQKKSGLFSKNWIVGFIFIIWLIIFMVSPTTGLYILTSILSGRGGHYGGGSGGGWSGGGGRSSGGGASGGW